MQSAIEAISISQKPDRKLSAHAALTLSYGREDAVTDSTNLRIAKDDSAGNWINVGGTGIGNDTGSISSSVNFSGFGDFVLANTSAGRNAFAMRWIATEAKLLGRQVTVSWTIANEVNIKEYTIERSTDGLSFVEIGQVTARTVAAAEKQYEYVDQLPLNGANFYRIRQTDRSANFNYSKTVQADVDGVADFIVWPSPATTNVNIRNRQLILRLQCYNSNGQLVYDIKPYTNFCSIPVRRWAAGVYQVKISETGGVIQTRFVKQ